MPGKLKAQDWLLGGTCCLLGLAGVVALPVAAGRSTDPLWPLVLWSVGWLLVGVWLLRLPQRLLGGRLPGVRWEELSGGSLVSAAGLALVLIPFLDARDGAFPAGRLVVAAVGVMFGLGGVVILHQAFVPPGRGDTSFFHVAVALVVTLFAGVVGAVAAVLAFSEPRPSAWWIPVPGALLLAFLAGSAWREVWRVARRR